MPNDNHGFVVTLTLYPICTAVCVEQMLGEWYHRARIPLSSAIALDDHSAVDKLVCGVWRTSYSQQAEDA